MFSRFNLLDFEKHLVFVINLFFVLFVLFLFYNDLPLKYFFYSNILFTLVLSYFYFKKSKLLSKNLILTNLFILFLFLYPYVSEFLYELLGTQSYLFVLFYVLFLAYIFLVFSGEHYNLINGIKSFNPKLFTIVLLIGICFGLFFYGVQEPVPVPSLFNPIESDYIPKVFFFSLVLALSEQMMFSGFLFNIYRKLNSKKEAMLQVSVLFVLFHLLRFEFLAEAYFSRSQEFFLFFVALYYLLLFVFMMLCLYLYSFVGKKHSGNFIYPVVLHFSVDFSLLLCVWFFGMY